MNEKDLVYLEFEFKIVPLQPASDILIAELGAIDFESFVETETGITAYVQKEDYFEAAFNQIGILQQPDFNIQFSIKEIVQQNWNAEWEKNFNPIYVGEDCVVRAPFHERKEVKYDIIIEPKMSFGTGHHETTAMMMQHVLEQDFKSKRVLDMGCGTGVLAILAEKRGATEIDAVDIDAWCYENALENVELNKCTNIQVAQGDATILIEKKYDVVLANINRNILLQDIPKYVSVLKSDGVLVLSGFYNGDEETITQKCANELLIKEKKIEKNQWVAVKYVF